MYRLNSLPYEYDELEPYIDTHTLGLHKNKHERNYLNKLNDLLIKNNYDFGYSLYDLVMNIDNFNFSDVDDILFNLGGVINHEIYFNSMSSKRVMPNDNLSVLIDSKFGSFDGFKDEFKKSALSIKGSGYTFLVLDGNDLKVINLLNQDNPISYGYIPLIGLDMWEHAYYINYQNKKDLYIDNFFDVIDFSLANQIF